MPRDRLGLFYSSLLPKYRRHDHSTDQTIIDLFDKGLSNQDISSIVNHLCGASYSKQTVSNNTDKCIENIDKFKSRQLSKEYAVVIRMQHAWPYEEILSQKEAVHIAVGITVEGTKEILGYSIAPNESAEIWKELLEDFKSRGLESVPLFCTDGLAGMEEVR